eukprot:CAMPEP_0180063128 /NCGR_PEP_ID=MMETSP0985-20121206/7471_1 /TAXON_ID=483367 /ORGANISM="non described non described, Strain CCMP 2436" /LENGTH=250 /DNA_ID=CAMNT_0021993319 /DNA_START=175 /DNA_END=928 /DNA_ORIENTATION=+
MSHSDAKGGAAAARRGGVRVLEPEATTDESVRVVQLQPEEEHRALRVDDTAQPLHRVLDHEVVLVDGGRLDHVHDVAHTRAAARAHAHAQHQVAARECARLERDELRHRRGRDGDHLLLRAHQHISEPCASAQGERPASGGKGAAATARCHLQLATAAAAAAAAANGGTPDIPDLEDNDPLVAPLFALFEGNKPTADESLVIYCSRLSGMPRQQLIRQIIPLQQMGMVQMFDFSFTDVKIVLLSVGFTAA